MMKVEMAKTTRNYSIDLLRILACLAVVMAHVVSSPIDRTDPGTFDYNLCLFLNVPLKKLFSKNILRILTALVFWSGVYAMVLSKPFYPLGSQEAHFWYLGMIIGVYLAIPVLRYITANVVLMRYFLIVWFCVMVYTFVGHFVTLPFDMREVLFARYAGYCVLGYYVKTLAEGSSNDYPKIEKNGDAYIGLD